ncbi:hypothetical protein MTO96_045338 [Rhipicephalus appendiculatus]
MAPNATIDVSQSKTQANVKKPAKQRNKKAKHGEDHREDGANEAIKSPPDVDQGRERDPPSPEPPGHEQESGQQETNRPTAAEPAGQPSALGRMAKRISMSMPSTKKQELSNLAKVGR